MKIVAITFNIVMLAFTAMVRVTDGPAIEPAYVVFGWLLLAIPLLSVVVLLRRPAAVGGAGVQPQTETPDGPAKTGDHPAPGTALRVAAMAGNAVLLGFICWALIDQYPHPNEEGFIPYVVVVMATPILNLVVLSRDGLGHGWPALPLHRKG